MEVVEDDFEENTQLPISEIVLLEEGEDFSVEVIVAYQFAENGEFDHVVKYSVSCGGVNIQPKQTQMVLSYKKKILVSDLVIVY